MRQMMKDMRYRVLCAMMLATAVSISSCEQEPIPTPDEPQIVAPYVEGEVIVKFTAEVADMIAQSEATRGAATRSGGCGRGFGGDRGLSVGARLPD